MKVKDLIKNLLKLDQEARVVTRGYEGGYCDVENFEECQLTLNLPRNSAWYYGPHEKFDEDDPSTHPKRGEKTVKAYIL
jgi:hypothetical protein